MAELCKDCFYKYNPNCSLLLEISKDKELCEGCGEIKRVVIGFKRNYYTDILDFALSDIEAPTKEQKERIWRKIQSRIREE